MPFICFPWENKSRDARNYEDVSPCRWLFWVPVTKITCCSIIAKIASQAPREWKGINAGKDESLDELAAIRCRCDVTWRDSSFHTRAAATGKARSPTVDNRVRRTISDDDDTER